MQTAEDKIKTLKEQVESDKTKILKTLFVDDPLPLLIQPGLVIQLVMGCRSLIKLLKQLDENYEFNFNEIPGYINGRPAYIG